MTEELKHCAHCNHAAEWKYDKYADINIDNPDPFGKIFCLGCGMQTGELSTYSEAAIAWNRRVEPIGNSDELPQWAKEAIKKRIKSTISDGKKFCSGITDSLQYQSRIRELEWVLFLRKPESES